MPATTRPPVIRAPHGTALSCKGWVQEAAMRMLMNNLDPEVAEHPDQLIVYGGSGKAARNWESYHKIIETLQRLENDETLLVQSGKPVGVFKTHADATMNGAAFLGVDVDASRIQKRLDTGYCDRITSSLDEALAWLDEARTAGEALSVGLVANIADVLPELVRRGVTPDVLTDQTSA